MRVLTPKGRHYGNFLSFKFHWALLACLRWSLRTLGLPWVLFGRPLGHHLQPSGIHWGASGASLGSICRLWGSIEAPLGAFGGHWGSLVVGVTFGAFLTFLTFLSRLNCLVIFWKEKTPNTYPKCENISVFVIQIDYSQPTSFPQKRNIKFVCIFAGLKALHINSFTRFM